METAKNQCERLTRQDVQIVREHYRKKSADRHAREVRKRVQEVVENAFIALRKEDRFVFVELIPLERMSLPGRSIAERDLARYACDTRNLKGSDREFCDAISRFGRPFLLWTAPSSEAQLWLDLVD